MAASRPAFPSEPNLRRLGVGSSGGGAGGGGAGGGGDRALRAQLLIALVLAFALVAAVLYVLRRPSPAISATADGGPDSGAGSVPVGKVVRTRLEPPRKQSHREQVALAPAQRVKCSASPRSRGNEGSLCDALPFFEEALKKAILDNVACAPKTGEAGTLNYVLTVDFRAKRLGVFPGQSGAWKGPQAKRAADCVRRSLPVPQWESIPHQYGYYSIAILASYPAPDPLQGFTEFE
jgi:hypothetical protein